MKRMKKLGGLLLAMIMVMAMAVTAFAQDIVTDAAGKGTITISNASKGETYSIYKLFDATVSADGKNIAYTGTVPDNLKDYFEADKNGYVSATAAAKDGGNMSDGLKAALAEWVKTATKTATAESDGSTLNFKGLDYGYYVVTTTQGEQTISVDSTTPKAEIVDKNRTTPKELVKSVNDDDDDVNIGDTVTYTVTFETANYDGAGTGAKKIVSYTIEDTLPDFLKDVNVTSIIVDNDANPKTTNDQTNVTAQFTDKKITLDWYDDENGKFLYDNGASVTITYTAVVTDKVAIDGDGNTNKVTLTWDTEEGTTDDKLEDTAVIYSYAIALKKVNEKGENLAGAVFKLPFYVKSDADTDGAYLYAGTTAGEGLTNQLTTPTDGVLTIKGVATGTYKITEVTAPDGYNKLLEDVTVTATKTSETKTTTTFYLDENGTIVNEKTETTKEVTYTNDKIAATAILVVNKAGVELPSTGGIGTTIFYVVGGVLVILAVILLFVKKRVGKDA